MLGDVWLFLVKLVIYVLELTFRINCFAMLRVEDRDDWAGTQHLVVEIVFIFPLLEVYQGGRAVFLIVSKLPRIRLSLFL